MSNARRLGLDDSPGAGWAPPRGLWMEIDTSGAGSEWRQTHQVGAVNEELSFQSGLEGKKRCCTIMRRSLSARRGSSELDMVVYARHTSLWKVESGLGI